MPYKFRTSGPWGPGESEDLDAVDIDNNFWQAILDIAEKAVQGVGISNIIQTGNDLTFVLTDHTLLGPYTIPVVVPKFRGEWLPETSYLAGDIISNGGSTYGVLMNHVSEATFDPGANDGFGNDFYQLLLNNPALTLPTGGAVGSFLRKASLVDFDFQPDTAGLFDLSDVSILSPEPTEGEVLTFLGGLWRAAAATTALSQLSDVSLLDSPLPEAGQVLTFDGLVWTNIAPSGFIPVLDAPVAGQLLAYTGTHWTNQNTANIPVLSLGGLFGTITLDYALAAVQRVTVIGDTTLGSVANWPASGQFGRLLLEITNSGAFNWEWPASYKWPGGAQPEISISGRDIYALTTLDGGTTVSGSIIGQNYL